MAKSDKKTESGGSDKSMPVSTQRRAATPWDEMDRWLGDMVSRNWLRPHFEWPAWTEQHMPFAGRVPNVDLIDRDNELVLKAALPGVDRKDLDVSMTGNAVTIKAATSHEDKEEKGDYYRSEISRGSFSRTVTLPCAVDTAKVKATFQDGMLELTLPKVTQSQRKRIDVR